MNGNNPILKEEKDKLLTDLKESIKDVGFFGKKLFEPIIKLINDKYEKLPKSQREKIIETVEKIKSNSKSGTLKVKKIIKDIIDNLKNKDKSFKI